MDADLQERILGALISTPTFVALGLKLRTSSNTINAIIAIFYFLGPPFLISALLNALMHLYSPYGFSLVEAIVLGLLTIGLWVVVALRLRRAYPPFRSVRIEAAVPYPRAMGDFFRQLVVGSVVSAAISWGFVEWSIWSRFKIWAVVHQGPIFMIRYPGGLSAVESWFFCSSPS